MNSDAKIDKKGRIVIPKEMRRELGLRDGGKVKVSLGRGRILITAPVSPEEFIRKMEGCIKEGSPIPRIDPLKLKRIWEQP
ncbi:MAG: AbrB/MazE/SpoVT family DNA-binding domain-containing protein [Candidatus Geothermarchaeales archaeon]